MHSKPIGPTAFQAKAADGASRLAMMAFFVGVTWTFFVSGNINFTFWKWAMLVFPGSPIASIAVCTPLGLFVAWIASRAGQESVKTDNAFIATTWIAPIAAFFLTGPIVRLIA